MTNIDLSNDESLSLLGTQLLVLFLRLLTLKIVRLCIQNYFPRPIRFYRSPKILPRQLRLLGAEEYKTNTIVTLNFEFDFQGTGAHLGFFLGQGRFSEAGAQS